MIKKIFRIEVLNLLILLSLLGAFYKHIACQKPEIKYVVVEKKIIEKVEIPVVTERVVYKEVKVPYTVWRDKTITLEKPVIVYKEKPAVYYWCPRCNRYDIPGW